MKGLYPLCDVDALAKVGLAPEAFVEAVLEARPPLLQVRAKHWSVERTRALLVTLRLPAGTQLVVNDHPELAAELGALVHVGQDDAAHVAGPFGRSTHTLEQLRRALAERPTYVAYGPVFDTASKENPERTVGAEGLAAAHALASAAGIPLCAIGGIDATRLALVAPHAELVAVIGALLHADARVVAQRAVALAASLEAAR